MTLRYVAGWHAQLTTGALRWSKKKKKKKKNLFVKFTTITITTENC